MRVLRVDLPGGPNDDEALMAWSALRGAPDEARAVEELARSAQMRSSPTAGSSSLGWER